MKHSARPILERGFAGLFRIHGGGLNESFTSPVKDTQYRGKALASVRSPRRRLQAESAPIRVVRTGSMVQKPEVCCRPAQCRACCRNQVCPCVSSNKRRERDQIDIVILMALLVLFSPIIFVYRLLTGDKFMPPGSRLGE
jgi:hypothetical protein